MGFTYKNFVAGVASSDTASATLTGTAVTAGDLIVSFVIWYDSTHALTHSFVDSSSGHSGAVHNEGVGSFADVRAAFFYKVASVATGLPTYTFTATGCAQIFFGTYVFTPSGTVTFDAQIGSATSFSSSSVDSGALAAAGSNVLILGGVGALNDATPVTAQAIGGTSATINQQNGYVLGLFSLAMWYLEKTGTNSATATLNSSQAWLANAISFVNTDSVPSTIVTSSSIIRVPGARRTMIIPG